MAKYTDAQWKEVDQLLVAQKSPKEIEKITGVKYSSVIGRRNKRVIEPVTQTLDFRKQAENLSAEFIQWLLNNAKVETKVVVTFQ